MSALLFEQGALMNIPKETVKEILDRVNIVELIGEYISLNKNGKKSA